jgi:hypothetical protein
MPEPYRFRSSAVTTYGIEVNVSITVPATVVRDWTGDARGVWAAAAIAQETATSAAKQVADAKEDVPF